MEINVYGTESYCTFVCRSPIKINTENYPELKGMSEDEVKEYIRDNAWDMKPSQESDVYDSLGEELMDMDIRRDKITNESQNINAQ
jgi:hypothetical protein